MNFSRWLRRNERHIVSKAALIENSPLFRLYIENYRGVRISKHGRRFMIEQATIWNLLDETGAPYGQAATFSQCRYLE